uniref:MARVEL domain-containing protein n=1 Tax=Panagrellus redivivus TaxID=6233 RepID=A0A7E4WAJ6_PANRE
MIYQIGSLFFIVGGIVVYAFLAESLFRVPRPCGVLAYLIFETLQIGFYIAAIMFSIIFVVMGSPTDEDGSDYESSTTTNQSNNTPSNDPFYQSGPAVIVVILGCVVLLVLKTYFVKIFTRYYRFVTYQTRHSNDLRAQYVHGRGVNLGFPSAAYDPTVIHDPSYGYSFPAPTTLPTLPTYGQAMSPEKQPSPAEPSTTTAETIDTTQTSPPEYRQSNLTVPTTPTVHHDMTDDPFTHPTGNISTPPYTSSIVPTHQNPPPFSP